MPRITYIVKKFAAPSLLIIEEANRILDEYAAQGFVLTLRQLYYQFVSRDLLSNTQKSYNRLASIISDARLAGYVDWDMLIDRTRNLSELEHFDDASDALTKLSSWYHLDYWQNQQYRPEVWIEKDALVGVIEGVCQDFDVPFFSCRGYTSQSEMWRAAQRLRRHITNGQVPVILHMGDHDSSGIDMSRDIEDRIRMFITQDWYNSEMNASEELTKGEIWKNIMDVNGEDCGGFQFRRLALNMDQVNEYEPPPNPAKISDPRAKRYIEVFGDESWELDALEPAVMAGLIRDQLTDLRDEDHWRETATRKQATKKRLKKLANDWEDEEWT